MRFTIFRFDGLGFEHSVAACDDPKLAFDIADRVVATAPLFNANGVGLSDAQYPDLRDLLDRRDDVFRPESYCPQCEEEYGPERYLPDLSHQLNEECESCQACPHDTREEKAGLR